jgi:hypothetical protein
MRHSLLLACLLLFSCGTAKPPAPPTVTLPAADLRKLTLAAAPRALVIMPDATYHLPKRAWVVGDFQAYYKGFADDQGLGAWRASGRDCDKFASLYRALAQVSFARNPAVTAQGLAVAQVHYRIGGDPARGHAINAFVDENKTLTFVEPQTCAVIVLSQQELQSVWLVFW